MEESEGTGRSRGRARGRGQSTPASIDESLHTMQAIRISPPPGESGNGSNCVTNCLIFFIFSIV